MAEKFVQLTKMVEVTNHGHILYIYDSTDAYINNVVSFIINGIEQGHQHLIIESHELSKRIQHKIEDILTKDQLDDVRFYNNRDYYGAHGDFNKENILENIFTIANGLDLNRNIRIWANVDWMEQVGIHSKLKEFEDIADTYIRDFNLITICAYDGKRISASLQNHLLRNHEYFMTDHELVKSTLYHKRITNLPTLSAQVNIEGELKATKHQLKSFIMQNLDSIVILDKTDTVVTVNHAFVETFGYSSSEILGLYVYNLPIIPKEKLNEINLIRSVTMVGEKIQGYETVRRTKEGKDIQVLITSFPLFDEDAQVNGWAVIFRDITEKKQAQDLLVKSEKLSLAGELAAGIAHEIRNPITSIKGFLQLMQSSKFEKQIYYEIMTSEIKRIELILSELLMLAKPQATHFASKDIIAIIKDVITLLEPQATLKNVRIISEIESEQTLILCEENQMKQVCINFIKNAIEAMTEGGDLIIRITNPTPEEVIIQFIDQGCGIPPELITKLGQPFYTAKEKGTGLGFMVSKRIIENHQGTVVIESKVNQGTTIKVSLPI